METIDFSVTTIWDLPIGVSFPIYDSDRNLIGGFSKANDQKLHCFIATGPTPLSLYTSSGLPFYMDVNFGSGRIFATLSEYHSPGSMKVEL